MDNVFADSLTYLQFKAAVINVQVQEKMINDDAFLPACVLGATCLVNTALIVNWDGRNKHALVHQTTAVFIIGGLLSVLTYLIQ